MANQKVLRSYTLPLGGYQQLFEKTTAESHQSFHIGTTMDLYEFYVDVCADDGGMIRESVAMVNTMKEFNKHWTNLSIINLPHGSIVHLFRFGGSPDIAHKTNKDGSQIRIVCQDSSTFFRLWHDLALYLVGCKDQDVVHNIHGVSCHPSCLLVKIWLGSNQEITKDLMLKSLATIIPGTADLSWRTPQEYEAPRPIVGVSTSCSFAGNNLAMGADRRKRANSCPDLFQYEFELQIAEPKVVRACTTTIELTSELHGKSFNNKDGSASRMPSALQVTKKGYDDHNSSSLGIRRIWSAGKFDEYLPASPLDRPDMGGGLKKVVSCDSLEDDEPPVLDSGDTPPQVLPNSSLAVGGEKSSARPYRVATYDGGFFSLPDVMPAIRPQLSTRSLPPAAAPPKEDAQSAKPEKLQIDLNAVLKYLQRTRNLCVSLTPEEPVVDDIKFSKSRSPRNRRKIRERKIREAAAIAKKEMQIWGPMYNQPVTSWIDPINNCTIDKPADIQEDEWFRLVQAHRKDLVCMRTLSTLSDDVLNTLGVTDENVRATIRAVDVIKLPDPNPLDAIIQEMIHNEVPCYLHETQLSPSMSASTKSPVRSPLTGELPAPTRIVTTMPPRDIPIPL